MKGKKYLILLYWIFRPNFGCCCFRFSFGHCSFLPTLLRNGPRASAFKIWSQSHSIPVRSTTCTAGWKCASYVWKLRVNSRVKMCKLSRVHWSRVHWLRASKSYYSALGWTEDSNKRTYQSINNYCHRHHPYLTFRATFFFSSLFLFFFLLKNSSSFSQPLFLRIFFLMFTKGKHGLQF